ncbi:MAG: hypothetical protein V4702_02425 [Patescibacteria group bacterium]
MADSAKPGFVRMAVEWGLVVGVGVSSFIGHQDLAGQHEEHSPGVIKTVGHAVLDHARVFGIAEPSPTHGAKHEGQLFGYDILGLISLGGYMYARRS